MANLFRAIIQWLADAGCGLVVTVVLAECMFALLLLFGGTQHLLWTVTEPAAAASSAPALVAVVWLIAAAAGSILATTLHGHLSAAFPAGLLPSAWMILMAWFYHQPSGMVGTLAFGPLVGCLLGIVSGRAVLRRDQAALNTLSPHGAEI